MQISLILYFLTTRVVFVEIYNIDNMIDKMKKFINIRDTFIDFISEINIGLIDILNNYGGV